MPRARKKTSQTGILAEIRRVIGCEADALRRARGAADASYARAVGLVQVHDLRARGL